MTMLARKTLSNGNRFAVHGGLHYIKGNHSPYFSLTYEETTRRGEFEAGGAGHEEILRRFPRFADLASLHLCDLDGAPMHAMENGFYHLGGTKWCGPNFSAVANHFRITEGEAEALARSIFKDHYSPTVGNLSGSPDLAKARLTTWVDRQRGRWRADADQCRKAHGLEVYGDEWKGDAL